MMLINSDLKFYKRTFLRPGTEFRELALRTGWIALARIGTRLGHDPEGR